VSVSGPVRVDADVRRRSELREFLMARRAQISPQEAGLAPGGRRRTPGLRREEVAVLAGVGSSWYQWLEQGRDITVSAQVLEAIGRVLRLDEPEVRHLYALAGLNPPPARAAEQPQGAEGVDRALIRLVDAWLKLVAARAEAQEGRRVAEAASRAKSDFLATMSHEIRTPLNGILGMAQALQVERPSAKQATGLRVIRSCGETLLAILDDVLDLAKVEAGRLTLEREAFDMESVTRGAVATFGPVAAGKGVKFAFSIDNAAKGTFVGDAVRLRQILYNLVSNAVKFTEHGAVGVSVGCAAGGVTLEVADSGPGIAPGDLERIFEKFVQADASRTRAAGGTGLGLAISRELVELMGGSIRVSSEPGRGSIFLATVPMARTGEAQPPPAAAVPAALAVAEERQAEAPLRILAAEDNDVNRLVLSTLLSRAGLSLTVVNNGLEAVTAWRSADWDVILMDVQMPVMDGVEATHEIRAEERSTGRPRTPIIAVTANAMPDQCAEYAAAGMDHVVTKPLDVGRLFRAIEGALESVRGADAA